MEMKPKEVAALQDWASYVAEKMAEKDSPVDNAPMDETDPVESVDIDEDALLKLAAFVKGTMAAPVKPFNGIAATPIEVLAKALKKDVKSCAKEAAKETALCIKATKISEQRDDYTTTHIATVRSYHPLDFYKGFRVWVTIHVEMVDDVVYVSLLARINELDFGAVATVYAELLRTLSLKKVFRKLNPKRILLRTLVTPKHLDIVCNAGVLVQQTDAEQVSSYDLRSNTDIEWRLEAGWKFVVFDVSERKGYATQNEPVAPIKQTTPNEQTTPVTESLPENDLALQYEKCAKQLFETLKITSSDAATKKESGGKFSSKKRLHCELLDGSAKVGLDFFVEASQNESGTIKISVVNADTHVPKHTTQIYTRLLNLNFYFDFCGVADYLSVCSQEKLPEVPLVKVASFLVKKSPFSYSFIPNIVHAYGYVFNQKTTEATEAEAKEKETKTKEGSQYDDYFRYEDYALFDEIKPTV